jgi:hypothetical protein
MSKLAADRVKELEAKVERQRQQVRDLIAESSGVTGLHLNGDLATWDEILNSWLSEFA